MKNIDNGNFIDNIKKIIKESFTGEEKEKLEYMTFYNNVTRYKIYFSILLIIDIVTLLVYAFILFSNENRYSFLTFIGLKIFFNLTFILILDKLTYKKYDRNSILMKNLDLLIPFICFFSELSLFILSPQNYGDLARFLLAPLIITNLLIIHPMRLLFFSIFILSFELIITNILSKLFFVETNISLLTSIYAEIISFIFINFSGLLNYYSQIKDFKDEKLQEEITNDLINSNEILQKLINTDKLTGLSNRLYFEEYLDILWANFLDKTDYIMIIIFDIDYMKRFNNTFGNPAGDEILVSISKIIDDVFRPSGYEVFRIEGDEFAVVTIIDDAKILLELSTQAIKNVESLEIENPNSNTSAYVTISAGVSIFNLDPALVQRTVIYQAYNCLSFSKKNKGNRVICTVGENNNFLDENMDYVESTSTAITDGEFEKKLSSGFLKNLNVNSVFLYSSSLNLLEFSTSASKNYNLPKIILNPTLEKIIEYISFEERDSFSKLFTSNTDNQIKDIIIDTKINTIRHQHQSIVIIMKIIYVKGRIDTLSGYMVSLNDLVKFNRYLQNEAQIDTLTKLPNRRKFYEDMDLVLNDKDDYGYLVLLDINNFKAINSIYSHSIGDKVLNKLGELIKLISSKDGSIYNYSIDQFIIIFKHYDYKKTQEFMTKVHTYFDKESLIIDDLNIRINFSMSAVEFKPHSKKVDELMIDLDITITKVKYETQNGYAFFNKRDKTSYLDKVSLEKSLRDAIENNMEGFYLYYQPILNSKTKKCVGAEALLRWNNGLGDVISPNIFIPILEILNQMEIVENWVINTSASQCRKWIAASGEEDFFMHINLSPLIIKRSSLLTEVINAVKQNQLEVKNIRLEVTETSVLREVKSSINVLKELRKNGFKIAVDDFGIGYSALSYLNSLPIDEIKIDKSFLNFIETSKSSAELLISIANMAKSMGFLVCVEGVETIGQVEFLDKLNIDYLQGFYYAKPLPPNILFKNFIKK